MNLNIYKLLEGGAKINLITEQCIIYHARVLFAEEKEDESNYLLCFKRLFKLNNDGSLINSEKAPFQLLKLNSFEFELSDEEFKFGDFSISSIQSPNDQKTFDDWMSEFKITPGYSVYNHTFDLEIEKCWKKKVREIIHSKHFY